MGTQVAQVKFPMIKDYRNVRDGLFADLKGCEKDSPQYDAIRNQIYELDETNAEHIDEGMDGMVHAESLNFGDIKRRFEHIPQDLGIDPHKIVDAIRGEFQHILVEGAVPIAKKIFKTSAEFATALYHHLESVRADYPDLSDEIDKVAIPISLSVVNLEYEGFMRRAEGLCRLLSEQADHFQFNRHSIKWIINNTGPNKIGITLSGELFSSVLSFSIGVNMSSKLAAEIVDVALEKAGVPE